MGTSPTVADYMTPSPYTIGAEQSAHLALQRMRQLRVHHLPVLHGGELVGMLSERDAYLVLTLAGEGEFVQIEEVMSAEPYCVAPTDSLETVARTLASRHIGSAIVTEGKRVVGVLTTTDALHALADQLQAGSSMGDALNEHRSRQFRLAHLARLEQLATTADRAAEALLADGDQNASVAFARRLKRLVRVLSIETEEENWAAVQDITGELHQQEGRLDNQPGSARNVVDEVRSSLQRLRNEIDRASHAASSEPPG